MSNMKNIRMKRSAKRHTYRFRRRMAAVGIILAVGLILLTAVTIASAAGPGPYVVRLSESKKLP